jgi:hypothetical protein
MESCVPTVQLPSDTTQIILSLLDTVSYKHYHMINTTLWKIYTDKCDLIMAAAIKCITKRSHDQPHYMTIGTRRVDIYHHCIATRTTRSNTKHVVKKHNIPLQTDVKLYPWRTYDSALYTQTIIFRSNIDTEVCINRHLQRYLIDPLLVKLYNQYTLWGGEKCLVTLDIAAHC